MQAGVQWCAVVVLSCPFGVCALGCESNSDAAEGDDVFVVNGSPDGGTGSVDATAAAGHGGTQNSVADAAAVADGASAADAAAIADVAIPELSPCMLACDRVVDCTAEACSGVDWRTARLAYTACARSCDDGFAEAIQGAGSCDAVVADARQRIEELNTLCDADICQLACDHFANCVIAACPNFAEDDRDDLIRGCADSCTDEDSGDMLNATCDDLMVALSEEERFMASCQDPIVCSGADLCGPYSDKVSGCIVELCSGNADPFATGLQEAIAAFCMDDEDCVSTVDATFILDASITCDSPELRNLGADPPFDRLCAGTLGVSHGELVAACNTLLGCGADLGSVDRCTVLLALSDDPESNAQCIAAAAGCTAAFACVGAP